MPRIDGTGPFGQGAGSGRGKGPCSGIAKDDLSVIVLRFIFSYWKPILGLFTTIVLPVITKKLLGSAYKPSVLTAEIKKREIETDKDAASKGNFLSW